MRGLYAIVDLQTLDNHGLDAIRFGAALLQPGVAAMQVRDKAPGAGRALAALEGLRPLCEEHQVPLFSNDRADLAALARCDGVHVGQEDLPHGEARRLAQHGPQSPLVGLSLHNDQQLASVRDLPPSDRPDYIAFGPVFNTSSKQNPDPVLGLEGLKRLADDAAALCLPTVAIGGLTLQHAADVARICSCMAVISALVPEQGHADPYAWVRAQAGLFITAMGAPE